VELLDPIGFSLWDFAKIATLVFLLLYIVFSVVVIRQVRLMTDTLEVGFEAPLILVSFLHFIFAAGVFILALFIL
jgi:hypothetical protein